MTISLTLGWWLLPTAITVISLAFALWPVKVKDYHPVSILFGGFEALARIATATIISLLSWVIYLALYIALN